MRIEKPAWGGGGKRRKGKQGERTRKLLKSNISSKYKGSKGNMWTLRVREVERNFTQMSERLSTI